MKMNSGYDGTKREMHPTNIKQKIGYLGLHERILEVGDDKHMVFQEGGNVPLWVNPQDPLGTNFGL